MSLAVRKLQGILGTEAQNLTSRNAKTRRKVMPLYRKVMPLYK
jgi:hypothetical protein